MNTDYMQIQCPNKPELPLCGEHRGMLSECKTCPYNEDLTYYTVQSTIAQRCPICDGRGIVQGGFYNSLGGSVLSTNVTEPCRTCAGAGIIYVKQ